MVTFLCQKESLIVLDLITVQQAQLCCSCSHDCQNKNLQAKVYARVLVPSVELHYITQDLFQLYVALEPPL